MGAGISERGQSGSGCFSGLSVLYTSCHEVRLTPVYSLLTLMYPDKVRLTPENSLLPLMYYDEVKLSPVNSLLTFKYIIR